MFIFLEGPDGAGKSTLAKTMSEQLGYDIVHFSYPRNQHEKDAMFEMYTDFIHGNHNLIVDRCWYSDMVYARPVRKESPSISIHQMYELEKLVISEGGGIVIHCTDNIGRLWERFQARGDDYVNADFQLLNAIKKGYEELMHKVPHILPVVRYGINPRVPRL